MNLGVGKEMILLFQNENISYLREKM